MARQLPDIPGRFVKNTQASLEVVSATEVLWTTAPPASAVRKQLKVGQLEALYESVFLRIFAAWETVVEDLVVYYMAGYESPGYSPVLSGTSPGTTLRAARSALYGSRDYLLWHSSRKIVTQASRWVSGSPVELVAAGAAAEIDRFASLRHAIAHSSEDARAKFQASAKALSGYEHKTVGRFLRSSDREDPLNPVKQILVIRNRLADLVTSMAQ